MEDLGDRWDGIDRYLGEKAWKLSGSASGQRPGKQEQTKTEIAVLYARDMLEFWPTFIPFLLVTKDLGDGS